jgi:hypothetical protein
VAGMLQGMLTFNAIIVENLDILSELVLIWFKLEGILKELIKLKHHMFRHEFLDEWTLLLEVILKYWHSYKRHFWTF